MMTILQEWTPLPLMQSWICKTARKIQLRSFVTFFLIQPHVMNTTRHLIHDLRKLRRDIRRLRLILLQIVPVFECNIRVVVTSEYSE